MPGMAGKGSRILLGGWLALAVLAGACQDIGPPRRPPHFGKRRTAEEGLETLLAVPVAIVCESAMLVVSPDYRREVRITGARVEDGPAGGASGRGDCRLVFRSLAVECQAFTLTVRPEEQGLLRLAAAGEVKVRRAESTFQARGLVIEEGRMTYHGTPRLDIEWAAPMKPPR